MASAGTEHYSLGLRRGNSFKQGGPPGTVPAPPAEKPSEGRTWYQAQQQVKPLWRLEKKHVGTLSSGHGPGGLGITPQPAYFFYPGPLCGSGPTAVIAGHGTSPCHLHSLPDLFSSTLLYRRSNYRHKPYQQLESFCLRSSPSDKRPFTLSRRSLPVGLPVPKVITPAVGSSLPGAMASSAPDPGLPLRAAGEHSSGKSMAPAISGKIPSSLSPSYKPVLNNNSFLRPNSTKVPSQQVSEGLKPVPPPKIPLPVSWHHSGGTGDCSPLHLEHRVSKSNGTIPDHATVHNTTTTTTPPTLNTLTTTTTSPPARGASPTHGQNGPPPLKAERPSWALEAKDGPRSFSREIRLTEAVRKLTGRGYAKMGQGYRFERSCLMNPSFHWNLLNGNGRWQPPVVTPRFAREDGVLETRPLTDGSDSVGLDSTVFCTKRISIHLLASHSTPPNNEPASGNGMNNTGEKPQAHTVTDVTNRISSIHLNQSVKGQKEGKQQQQQQQKNNSSARNFSSNTDLFHGEAEDVEEELGDGLEDCCSQDEDEEEDEDSECSSVSGVSASESVAVISRNCMEVLPKPLANHEKVVRQPLIYSLFPNVPPTIYFGTRDERVEKLPWEQRKLLRWKMSTVTPNIVKQTIGRSHFKVSKKNDDWLGCWGHHMKSPSFKTIREHQKLNHFPGSFQIGRKDRLWRNLSRMQSRFGKKEFSFFPQSFILPQDAKLLRKAWESSSRQKWIVKPPASARGIGIQVIHKWSQLPKRRPLLVQRYLHKPYLISGSKFDLRIYVYVTSYDPLRIYLFTDGLVRFASCKYSSSMKSLGNKFIHLTNYSINKKNTEYQANTDENACQGHKWALKALWNYLSQKGVNSDAIWEKIKDVVVKTIIASEPYVTSLLKMYVRRPYSCHELFGFDIMLDENLKPWVLEVNISPSLHSNSPLDISIKGQMIRDLLNLAGFVLPHAEDVNSSCGSSSSSTISLSSSTKEKTRLAPEYFTAEKMKKAYYLTQKLPDQDFYASVLDILTPDDVRVLVEMEDEFSRRGQFERVFPSRVSSRYLRFFEQPRYFNILTTQWEQKYHSNKLKGVDLLRSWCYKGFHTGTVSDSAPMWSLPRSHIVMKGDILLNAFCKTELNKLGKTPHSTKDNEDTTQASSPCSPVLPMLKYTGQAQRLPVSSSTSKVNNNLVASVSP
ncbi:tubulin monoglutamylase TTLL4 isoform X1 [Monodelphis domestica]|uniref:Tubulin tyrosine ligase like 4 n=1 Tax=Monodelphis domestica TaxID=13616 RepID=F6WH44_MONDO|nr:tubulin monoglutamylase TTLL4 isoform X1 [Monodelphis domestica]XP_007501778.1 tubulin monoglutamylase TTLL4 isoform X1 [Monodelphis domestica]XP_007501779.1 tubulin monoglutamylase TTLL4 isoform X1 [Monodelphis domestica]XP_007501780.1 tubulin monoglutamylase TTLL4 isoform X1 [Monodelphis domestica]XP_007501783.1 tubulin monoglutamylase TTLL4 isoform X1 [Monodelphis domestica]XP_007501786.1 tubulin monoglutamylase TTLL4 isoform X1 [Monodelphis domestica]XP_007501787.1 tubulin monoglutamyl